MSGRRSDGEPLNEQEREQVLRTERRLASAVEELAQAVRQSVTPPAIESVETLSLALRAVDEMTQAANRIFQLEILLARRGSQGVQPLSWADIGDQLGDVSKQALNKRFKGIAGTQDISLVTAELVRDSDQGQALATRLHDVLRTQASTKRGASHAPGDGERRVLLHAASNAAATLRGLARAIRHSSDGRVPTYRHEGQLALRAADALGSGSGELLYLEVLLARHGRSLLTWPQVGECLGQSKQAVHSRYNRSVTEANIGAMTAQVRSQAAQSNELAIQLEESVRLGRDQHRGALEQDKLRRAAARPYSGGSSPLEPEPYDPAVEAWVRGLADRAVLARPDKNGPPEDYESPRDYFNSHPGGRFTTRLSWYRA